MATAATLRLSSRASTRAGYLNGSFQASSEKPFQTKLNFPTGALNEKATITATGQEQVEEDERGVGVQEEAAEAPEQRRGGEALPDGVLVLGGAGSPR